MGKSMVSCKFSLKPIKPIKPIKQTIKPSCFGKFESYFFDLFVPFASTCQNATCHWCCASFFTSWLHLLWRHVCSEHVHLCMPYPSILSFLLLLLFFEKKHKYDWTFPWLKPLKASLHSWNLGFDQLSVVYLSTFIWWVLEKTGHFQTGDRYGRGYPSQSLSLGWPILVCPDNADDLWLVVLVLFKNQTHRRRMWSQLSRMNNTSFDSTIGVIHSLKICQNNGKMQEKLFLTLKHDVKMNNIFFRAKTCVLLSHIF